MSNSPVVTLAMQRSGTKFFGSSLNSGQRYWSFGEVLHPQDRKKESNLASFLQREQRYLFGATLLEIFSALDDYFIYLTALKPERIPHIDIMYNNLGALSPVWSYPGLIDPILFLEYFKSRRIGVVHIVRDSAFDAFVSIQVANARGVYHARTDETATQAAEIEIDLDQMCQFALKNLEARAAIRKQMTGYAHYIEIRYPSFCKDNSIVEDQANYAKIFVTDEGLFGDSSFRKTTDYRFVNILNKEKAEKRYLEVVSRLGAIN